MREPAFWWQPGKGSLLLTPLAAVYAAAAWLRMKRKGRSAKVPVICLGNLRFS
jgi:tetraacyldisaccharide-1-P 4'-kinase